MKTNLLILITATVFASACTSNVGTNQPVANSTNAANSATNAPTETKKEKTDSTDKSDAKTSKPADSGSNDPKSDKEQIQFTKGSTDTTLERTIAPGVNKMYMFNAKKGQIVWFKVTENSDQLEVDFNKNPVTLGEEVRQPLNASGDWAIYVNNPTDKPLKYTLWIGIE
jgi:hypothetical protein